MNFGRIWQQWNVARPGGATPGPGHGAPEEVVA